MNGMMKMFGMMKEFQKFKKDPMGAMASKWNIPQNIDINNTNAVAQHLLNSKQISQDAYNNFMQMQNMISG